MAALMRLGSGDELDMYGRVGAYHERSSFGLSSSTSPGWSTEHTKSKPILSEAGIAEGSASSAAELGTFTPNITSGI